MTDDAFGCGSAALRLCGDFFSSSKAVLGVLCRSSCKITYMAPALVSVVVLNHNGLDYLKTCLSSLRAQSYRALEILLVDNGSEDGSVSWVRGHYPDVQVLAAGVNLGFSGGNNFGFRRATGKYVAILNNDAVAAPDWIEKLVQAAELNPQYGMFGSKILLYDKPERLDKAGHLMYWDGQNKGNGSGELDDARYSQPGEIFFPDGCAALFRRSLLEDIGGFDEKFFAYGDDADLGIRARLRGWKAYYVPDSRVWHRHSATAGPYSARKVFWVERNRFWLAIKSFPLPLLLLSPVFTANRLFWNLWYCAAGRGAAANFRGQHSTLALGRAVIFAYFDGLRKIGPILKDRRRVRRNRTISDREFIFLLKRFNISARDLAARD
jgi:GT2 family glycosyltransferase